MPRKARREWVERGLYLAGKTYIASATPPGARRPRFKSLGQVGLMEARRLRDEYRVQLRSERPAVRGADRRMGFRDVAEDWLRRQEHLAQIGELRPRTLDAYRTAARRHLIPHFGNRRVAQITPEDLVDWHGRQRAKGAAAWSIKGRWTALRLILRHAGRLGLVQQSPADLLDRRERPRSGERRQRFLTDVEMRRLLAAAPVRYRPLVAVCLFAGLRIAEAVGLVWQDVDFDAGVIRVRQQLSRQGRRERIKTPAGQRDVVMMPALAGALRRAKMAAPFSGDRDPVFVTGARTPMSASNATRSFVKTTGRAGLDGVTFHALRHTFASMLIAQGRDVVFVADQLGHASPAITLRVYAHLFRAAKQAREARDQLEDEYGDLLRGAE